MGYTLTQNRQTVSLDLEHLGFAATTTSRGRHSLAWRCLIETIKINRSSCMWCKQLALDLCSASVVVSDANTFRTSDCDMPNCRAMTDGLMPALNAARTALICRGSKSSAPTSTCGPWAICPFETTAAVAIDQVYLPERWVAICRALSLFERRCNEQVQFSIIEMFDGVGQVLWRDMRPLLRGRVPCRWGRRSGRRR